jgi:hypothetical protein
MAEKTLQHRAYRNEAINLGIKAKTQVRKGNANLARQYAAHAAQMARKSLG